MGKAFYISNIFRQYNVKVNHCICVIQLEMQVPVLNRSGLSTSYEQRQTALSGKHFMLLGLKINNTTFSNIIEYLYEQWPVVNGSFLRAISDTHFHPQLCILSYYTQ